MLISEILYAAAALIEPPGAWTQGAYARDAYNRTVMATSPTAACRCGIGAVRAVLGTDSSAKAARPSLNFFKEKQGDSLWSFNDEEGRTQAEVVAEMRRVAALAEVEGV